MGMIQHTALIVTSWDKNKLEKAYKKAKKMFPKNTVSRIAGTGMNGYKHFTIYPTGSKLGWLLNEEHLYRLDDFIAYLYKFAYDDGSNCIEYVRVNYGEFGAKLEDHNCKNTLD
jgi:hypothetical protein